MREQWREHAMAQAGMVTRAQLASVGMSQSKVRAQLAARRWAAHGSRVIATFTGELSEAQRMWTAVLQYGHGAVVGGLTSARLAGLRGWEREELQIWIPYRCGPAEPLCGVTYVRSRKPLGLASHRDGDIPRLRLEPALLLWGATQRNSRSATGVLAAAVQQRLTTPDTIAAWHKKLGKLKHAAAIREALADMSGGAQSVAEMDLRRMCRRHGLALPRRQTRRRDAGGRLRYTDAEWTTSDGRTVVLEVDGAFHMDTGQWEEDIARTRGLSDVGRTVVHATAREVRDDDAILAADLRRLGVPSVRDGARAS